MWGVLAGAALWGVSGNAAQELFRHGAVDPLWLVAVRMLAGGSGLLAGWRLAGHRALPRLRPGDAWRLVVFALAGLGPVQYTYLAAIRDGNAVAATLLQYLAPVLLMGWAAWRERRRPLWREIAGWLLAAGSTTVLLTDGRTGSLWVPPAAVAWGLASAVAAAFYTAYPRRLILRYGAIPVVGWGLVVGGLPFAYRHDELDPRGLGGAGRDVGGVYPVFGQSCVASARRGESSSRRGTPGGDGCGRRVAPCAF
jgi:drug/metabolite transporter (DMT)-like permease